jgi:hypothetical protein
MLWPLRDIPSSSMLLPSLAGTSEHCIIPSRASLEIKGHDGKRTATGKRPEIYQCGSILPMVYLRRCSNPQDAISSSPSSLVDPSRKEFGTFRQWMPHLHSERLHFIPRMRRNYQMTSEPVDTPSIQPIFI